MDMPWNSACAVYDVENRRVYRVEPSTGNVFEDLGLPDEQIGWRKRTWHA